MKNFYFFILLITFMHLKSAPVSQNSANISTDPRVYGTSYGIEQQINLDDVPVEKERFIGKPQDLLSTQEIK